MKTKILVLFLALFSSISYAKDEKVQSSNSLHLKINWSYNDSAGLEVEYNRLLLKHLAANLAYKYSFIGGMAKFTLDSFGIHSHNLQAGVRYYIYRTGQMSGFYLQGYGGMGSYDLDSASGPQCRGEFNAHIGSELGFAGHSSSNGFGFSLFARIEGWYLPLCFDNDDSSFQVIGPSFGASLGLSF